VRRRPPFPFSGLLVEGEDWTGVGIGLEVDSADFPFTGVSIYTYLRIHARTLAFQLTILAAANRSFGASRKFTSIGVLEVFERRTNIHIYIPIHDREYKTVN